MTGKRFYCKKDGNNQWTVSDRLNQYSMPITSLEFCSVVANALNGLWEQTVRFEKYNQDYMKENEQLKERNKRFEEKIQRERNSFIKTHERWSKEAETKIKELSEENEQLKQSNERLLKMLDNIANYMQKQNKYMPIDDFVEWWNGIATKGLDDGDVE